jgi:tetratricopeptide (TPR) repeat protein
MEEATNRSRDVEKWINLANEAADEGNKEETREYLLKAVKVDPECVRAWDNLSYFAESREEEIYALEKVLQFQPENLSAAERLLKVKRDTV